MPLYQLDIQHAVAGTRRTALVLADDEEVASLGAGVGRDEVAQVAPAQLLDVGYAGLRSGRHPGAKDMAAFYQVVHDCLRIGLVLPAALEMAAAQQDVPRLGGTIGALLRDVRSGASLTDAARGHPGIFDAATLGLIQAGEVSGELEETFRMLAQIAARRERLASQLKKSATYPCVVLVLMVAVMLYVSVTLVPSMARTYADFGAQLPWVTRVVITISGLIRGEPVLWAAVIGLATAIWMGRYRIAASTVFQDVVASLPVLGRLLAQVRQARVLRTLAMLIGAGVRTQEAFELAAASAGPTRLSTALRDIAERVSRGEDLALAFAHQQAAFGADGTRLVAFLRVGTHTGKPAAVLGQLADEADISVERTASVLDKLLEPLLLSVLAIGVGGLLFSVYFPLFSLGRVILKG